MKKFEFDAAGTLKITVSSTAKDVGGNDVLQCVQHDIQASQIKAHMPMFKDEMTAAEKFKAYGIIEALGAQ